MGKETCKVTFLNTRITSGNWCRALRNHMGKETCQVTFLNTIITSGNGCRAFRNNMGKETGKNISKHLNYIWQLVSYF